MQMNRRLKGFLETLRCDYKIDVRLNWEREAFKSETGGYPAPIVRHYTFHWLKECPRPNDVPLTGIFIDYGVDGYAFYPEARTNTQRADFALISGQSETSLEMANN